MIPAILRLLRHPGRRKGAQKPEPHPLQFDRKSRRLTAYSARIA
jgi:hypothetical protein